MEDQLQANKAVTSAEMTAWWRSQNPSISKDYLSSELTSPEGRAQADRFMETVYPLVPRHITIRPRYFYNNAISRLNSEKHDACISIGSGFSMLLYHIAKALQGNANNIQFLDTDLPNILEVRSKRIKTKLKDRLDSSIESNMSSQTLNIQQAFDKKLNFRDLFPHYHAPLFIMEGVLCFLTPDCVDWIFSEIRNYKYSAIIVDYFSKQTHESNLLNDAAQFVNGKLPETIQSFVSQSDIKQYQGNSLNVNVTSVCELEKQFFPEHLCQLTPHNTLPVELACFYK